MVVLTFHVGALTHFNTSKCSHQNDEYRPLSLLACRRLHVDWQSKACINQTNILIQRTSQNLSGAYNSYKQWTVFVVCTCTRMLLYVLVVTRMYSSGV